MDDKERTIRQRAIWSCRAGRGLERCAHCSDSNVAGICPKNSATQVYQRCRRCGFVLTGPNEEAARLCIPCAEEITGKRGLAALRAYEEGCNGR